VAYIDEKVRLAGQNNPGYLDVEKINVVLKTLQEWLQECAFLKIPQDHISIVATEAIRKAKNQNVLLEGYQKLDSKIPLTVLTHQQEAYYGALGALIHLTKLSHPVYVVEMGGASMQISYVENLNKNSLKNLKSFLFDAFGVEHIRHQVISFSENYSLALKQTEDYLKTHTEFGQLQQKSSDQKKVLVLTGGTFWKIRELMVMKRLQKSEDQQIDREAFQKLILKINSGSYEEIKSYVQSEFNEVESFLIGVKTLEGLIDVLKPEMIMTGMGALRHGIAVKMMKRNYI
jgi:exopolyphosphatase/pppGpp-phosphohydrolase